MARKSAGVRLVLKRLERGQGRSSLFHWMVEHHGQLTRRPWQSRALRWKDLAEALADLGLLDRTGNPASAETARQTWLRARKAVQRADETLACEAAAKAARQAQPARFMAASPNQALPPVQRQAVNHSTNPSGPEPLAPGPLGDETEAEADARAEAEINRLRRTIAERAWLIPPRQWTS